MKGKNKIKRFLTVSMSLIGVFCITIFVLLGVYMNNRNSKTVSEVGGLYMAAMNERISQHFSTMLDMRLNQLETLTESIPETTSTDQSRKVLVDNPTTRAWLKYNGDIRGFDALAYYFNDKSFEMVYGDPVNIVDVNNFHDCMLEGKKNITIGEDANKHQSAIVGIPFQIAVTDESTGEVKTSISIVGRMPIEYISETLSLDEVNSLIYSFVIRKDGSFVVRTAGAKLDNYFDRVRTRYESVEGKDNVEDYITELKAAMEAKKDYSGTFYIDGDRRQLYCSDLPSSEWYLITFLPYGPLNEAVEAQGKQTFMVSSTCCALILIMLIAVFCVYSKFNHEQILILEEATKTAEEAKKTAEEASKSKSEFLSNMSHDIRTPMNAIVGMTAIALANIDDSARVENSLKKIALSSRHLLGLINDILDMSKIESGKMILNSEFVSLKEVMEGIVSIVQPQIKAKQQRFDIFIYDITSENVICDSVRFNQILINLLSNAIKFTPEGGSIEVSLHEQESPKGENYVRLLIRVKDTGIGMSPEFLTHLFDSFAREDRKRVQKTEGTGLGMAITKYIVNAMGGTIDVKSEQGVGTEFNVALDFEKTEEREEDMILPSFTMLVVDDDQQLCESTVTSLKSIGVRADYTLDGETAIEVVNKHHEKHDDYHIILLDLKLPGIDGIETARQLRKKLGKDVPILLISAYDWSEIEAEAREAGINGFLSKPLFKSTLYYGLKPFIGLDVPSIEKTQEKIKFTNKRLLLAEDNDLNWEIAYELLSDLGLELERAENGEICIEKFNASPIGYYDAILMDIRMPVKDGYEATQAIRKLDREDAKLPIIAMTADAFAEDIQRCLDYGMNAHVAKPIDIKELSRILARYFN